MSAASFASAIARTSSSRSTAWWKRCREAARPQPIGTTSRGIGPCYEDKIGRRGIRMADLLDRRSSAPQYDAAAGRQGHHRPRFRHRQRASTSTPSCARVRRLRRALRPMVCDTARCSTTPSAHGKSVLFEGAQGTMLDIDHGTYPFVTSSSASAGGACTGTGVAAHAHRRHHRRLEGLHHARRRRPVPDRRLTTTHGELHPQARQRIRRGHRPSAPLRLVRRARCCATPPSSTASTGWSSPSSTCSTSSTRFPSASATASMAARSTDMPATSPRIAKIEPVYETRARLEHPNLRTDELRRSAGEGQALHGVSGSPNGRRSRLHLHRPGAQPDHRPPRLPLRKTRRLLLSGCFS